jgi:hypothetical protein
LKVARSGGVSWIELYGSVAALDASAPAALLDEGSRRGRRCFGRLNILLSFAQFERELAGERIRDKFAASRAKGMWMGGISPLGHASWW